MSKKLIDWYDDYINSHIKVLQNGQITGLNSLDLYHFCNKFKEQIADLEAKLAESEERVKDLEFRNKNLAHSLKVAPNANAGQRQRIVELKEINHKLKQQLAEKEKQIEEVKKWWAYQYNREMKNQHQDKISFAVEQLENAKEKIIKTPITDYDLSGNFEKMYKQDAIRQVDNQIKEIKGEK